MTQPIRALVAKDPSSVPHTHMNHPCAVSGGPVLSNDLHRHQACLWYPYIYAGKRLMHKKISLKRTFKNSNKVKYKIQKPQVSTYMNYYEMNASV